MPGQIPYIASMDSKTSLIGLDFEALKIGARGCRRGAEGRAHARAPAVELDLCPRREGFRVDVEYRQGFPRRDGAALHAWPAGHRHRADLDRRHAQMAAEVRRPGIRDRLYPRSRSRHAVCLQPGRLHAQLPLLPHRHPEAGAQPDAGRNRRPAHGRARRARRLAQHGPGPQRHQRRHDGHGRAALQFRQCEGRACHRQSMATASRCRSAASRCRPPASCR